MSSRNKWLVGAVFWLTSSLCGSNIVDSAQFFDGYVLHVLGSFLYVWAQSFSCHYTEVARFPWYSLGGCLTYRKWLVGLTNVSRSCLCHLRRASEWWLSRRGRLLLSVICLFCIDLHFVGLALLLAEKRNQTMKLHVTKQFVYTLKNTFFPIFERKRSHAVCVFPLKNKNCAIHIPRKRFVVISKLRLKRWIYTRLSSAS